MPEVQYVIEDGGAARVHGQVERTLVLLIGELQCGTPYVQPRIIVGGSSAYPWDWDWKTLREIADECGAILLADIAHLAGMVVGGVLNNPLPHAHVVTFTTHKTLCGPRGAAIVTTCRETAKAIDNAVFLYLPARFTPGHEGALQHVGRGVVLLLLRMLAFGFVLAAAAAALASHLLLSELGWPALRSTAAAIALFSLVVSAEVFAVIAIGGRMLARFDVARDRG